MTFKEIMQNDLINVLFNKNEFAEDAILISNKIEITVTIIFEKSETNIKGNIVTDTGASDKYNFWILVNQAPKMNDKIRYKNEDYQIKKVVEQNLNSYKVETTKNEQPFANFKR